jgi:CheY-like chemotaxis protein
MAALAHISRKHRGRVLVVDDDQDIRHSVAEALEDEGYEVLTAADGSRALAMLLAARRPPDLIVLDLKMPGRSGYDVLDVLRHSVTLVDVPVVVLSAFLGSPPAGAIAWLRKPVLPDVLVGAVARHMAVMR